ncbi:MAG TPA: hypothetical protein VES67_15860 [Vicinamibacterales bacterium]|nr:hypothetical protein [Vicinamibacterales bacterium]
MRKVQAGVLVIVALFLTASVGAQAPVTAADLTRLDTAVAEIERQLATLNKTDVTLAAEVDKSLADLRDEVAYLKVKLRREGSVTRVEYSSLRDKLENLRLRAQGQKVSAQPTADDPILTVYTVPVGAEFDVRLQTPLHSGKVKVEQRFEGTTMLDYTIGRDVVVPAGSTVRGFVSSVKAAGKIERKGSLTLSFDEIRIGNRSHKLRASVTQALDPKVHDDATRIGAGAVVGAIIGGLLGGGKGALLGVLVGGGGTIAATEGTDVDLPVGTVLRIRVDQPLEIPKQG